MSGRPPFVYANMLLFEERPCASVDPNIEQLVVVGAGIGRGGTVAAREFLVDEQRMDEILKQVPRDWNRKNVEIVLETQVAGDRSGPPHVSAVYVW